MDENRIRVTILEDHQSIVDGYLYRFSENRRLQIAGIARFGEDLIPLLKENQTDVLILDIEVPTSEDNLNSYPILNAISNIRNMFPKVAILVISMYKQQVLIESLFEMGIKGYIYKDDNESILRLADIIIILNSGGVFFSQGAFEKLRALKSDKSRTLLSPRQLEVLSLCVAFPDSSTKELADRLNVSPSTFRNLLSGAYIKLGVRTRIAAIVELRRLGIGTSEYEDKF